MSGAAILIVGFGNRLLGDDGVGPEVSRRLQVCGLPTGVRSLEAETDSLILPGLWRGEPDVWMVDAVIRGAAPGTIHRLGHEEILAIPQRHATVHHLSLPESLRWIAHAFPEMAPVRYRLWGVEPGRLGLGTAMSPSVAQAARLVADEIHAAAHDAQRAP